MTKIVKKVKKPLPKVPKVPKLPKALLKPRIQLPEEGEELSEELQQAIAEEEKQWKSPPVKKPKAAKKGTPKSTKGVKGAKTTKGEDKEEDRGEDKDKVEDIEDKETLKKKKKKKKHGGNRALQTFTMPSTSPDGKVRKTRIRTFATPNQFIKIVDDYFLDCPDTRMIFVDDIPMSVPYPTYTGLVLYLGFSCRSAITRFAKAYPEYQDVVDMARSRMEKIYEQMLQGTSPTGAIFALKNFGWTDKESEEKLNTPPGIGTQNNLIFQVVDTETKGLVNQLLSGGRPGIPTRSTQGEDSDSIIDIEPSDDSDEAESK